MIITAKNLPVNVITATTLPGLNGQEPKNGFKIAGAWLNGSDQFKTAEDVQTYLIGKEISPSKSGKSLVVVGEFTPVDTKFLAKVLTQRETLVLDSVDLNELL